VACVNFTDFVFMLVLFMFKNVFGKFLKLGERKKEVQKLQKIKKIKWAQVTTS
jgi:hypothetical protein